jgi:hypothetical protein
MTFTAKLLDAVKHDTDWKITVEFTDGADVKVSSFRFSGSTTEQLKGFIRREVLSREIVKTVDFSQYIGQVLDLTPVIPPPPDPPPPLTAEEIAKKAWFSDWRKLGRLLELADRGLIDSADIRITDLQASLTADWLNVYLGDI